VADISGVSAAVAGFVYKLATGRNPSKADFEANR
jgi:hypothetical protein